MSSSLGRIACIRADEGWLYLAVGLDLFSRQVVGWPMKSQVASDSRRGNCHDNAVAESFFQRLKRERIKRKIYTAQKDARSDVLDYIEMFYI